MLWLDTGTSPPTLRVRDASDSAFEALLDGGEELDLVCNISRVVSGDWDYVTADLRAVITTMRISHELERTADLVVNVAKATRRLYPHTLDPRVRGIIDQMGQQAVSQTRVAIDAFADRDPTWAGALTDMDDAMDDLTKSLFRHILADTTGDEASVLRAVQVALVGRHYERMADHAVTIAERVEFMVTGNHPDKNEQK